MATSPLPNYVGCYVCGHGNSRGLNIRFFLEGDAVVARLQTDDSLAGYPDRIHGGLLATLLDETMGWAPCVRHGRFCVATEITVRYLKPVPVGARILVRGWVDGDPAVSARRLWDAAGEICGEDGVVYARGRGRYFPLSPEETDRIMSLLTVEGRSLPLAEAIRLARGEPGPGVPLRRGTLPADPGRPDNPSDGH